MGQGFINIMNVKISETSVTFKITEKELNHLLTGETLEQKVPIGGCDFVMLIDPAFSGHLEDIEKSSLRIVFDKSEPRLKLCTTMDEIRKLVDMGRNRDGLSARADNLDIFLQVDIRKDSRERKQI